MLAACLGSGRSSFSPPPQFPKTRSFTAAQIPTFVSPFSLFFFLMDYGFFVNRLRFPLLLLPALKDLPLFLSPFLVGPCLFRIFFPDTMRKKSPPHHNSQMPFFGILTFRERLTYPLSTPPRISDDPAHLCVWRAALPPPFTGDSIYTISLPFFPLCFFRSSSTLSMSEIPPFLPSSVTGPL